MTVLAITHIGIGAFGVVDGEGVLEANLGSCLGVLIAWPQQRRYGLAHVLLPEPYGKNPLDRPSRYANTAPEHLLGAMDVPPEHHRELRCIMAGCAQMFSTDSEIQVGPKNERAGRAALRRLSLRVLGIDTGGSVARRIRVDAATGVVTVFQMGTTIEKTEWTL